MLSKKYYEAIAYIVLNSRLNCKEVSSKLAIDYLQFQLEKFFKEDSYRFNTEKFRDACYGVTKTK